VAAGQHIAVVAQELPWPALAARGSEESLGKPRVSRIE
jgi:hypothetical protein